MHLFIIFSQIYDNCITAFEVRSSVKKNLVGRLGTNFQFLNYTKKITRTKHVKNIGKFYIKDTFMVTCLLFENTYKSSIHFQCF